MNVDELNKLMLVEQCPCLQGKKHAHIIVEMGMVCNCFPNTIGDETNCFLGNYIYVDIFIYVYMFFCREDPRLRFS